MSLSLDNDAHVETVVLLSKGAIDSKKARAAFSLENMDMSDFQKSVPEACLKSVTACTPLDL